ncbi:MAG: PAS domain S-box protein [bacterium]
MKYKLEDLIDITMFQSLQDRLNEVYSFPSAIIDNDGNILTATAWQDICTKFHRVNKECEKECIKSDQYILDHIHEANPAVSYKCPHGLVDNATPIIIEGVHYGNFFTGQFFLEEPNLEFFKEQAKKYGFDEVNYLEAVKKVPIWTQEQLDNYLFFIKGLIEVISGVGLKNLKEIEANVKIRESETKYRTLIEQTHDGIIQVDNEDVIQFVNPRFCELLGYDEKELLGRIGYNTILFEEDRELIKEKNKSRTTHVSEQYELKMKKKSGNPIYFIMTASPIKNQEGKVIGSMSVCTDISKRKLAEELLVESREYVNSIYLAAPIGIGVVSDRVLVRVNPELCDITGYSENELIGKNARIVYPDDDEYEFVGREKYKLIKEHGTGTVETKWKHKNGKIMDILLSSTPLYTNDLSKGVTFTALDITERKRAERYQKLSAEVLDILNKDLIMEVAIDNILRAINRVTDFDAVGIRLEKNGDYPYYVQNGFSDSFLKTENTLIEITKSGDVCRDEDGNISLECTCGLVISGKADLSLPFFTKHGSFWSNDTLPLLDLTDEEDPRHNPRNRCIHAGFMSIAIIPIRIENEIIGTLQLNDTRRDCFTEDMIHYFEGLSSSIGIALMRKKDEEALKESEETYRNIFQNSQVGLYRTRIEDGKILESNEQLALMFGYENREEFIAEYITSENYVDSGTRERMIKEISENGEITNFEARFYRKDKSIFWAMYSAQIFPEKGWIEGVAEDITERKIAEDTLRESEEKYRTLVENSMDAILTTIPDGRILSANEAACKMFGKTEEEICTKGREGIADISDSRIPLLLKQRKETGKAKGELTMLRNDGSCFEAEISSSIYKGKDNNLFTSMIIRDITERKKAEEALKESEEKFKNLANLLPQVVFETDINANLTYANQQAFDMFGYSDKDFENGINVLEVIKSEDRERAKENIKKIMGGEKVEEREYTALRKDGSTFSVLIFSSPIFKDNKPLGLRGILVDITERKEAEEALRESEIRFRQVAETTEEWIWEVDKNGMYTYSSPIVEKILGYKPEELVGKKYFYDLFSPDVREEFKAGAFNTFARKEAIKSLVNPNLHKDGRTIILETSGLPVLNKDGELIGYRGADSDITERKKFEEALKESEKKYRNVIENIHESLIIEDIEGQLVFANEEFCKIFGYDKSELQSISMLNFVSPESLEEVLTRHQRRMKGLLAEEEFVYRGIRKDGKKIWIESRVTPLFENGKIVGTQSLERDISERKMAEEDLQREKIYLDKLFASTPGAVAVLDNEDKVQKINNKFTELFGYEAKEAVGKHINELIVPDYLTEEANSLCSLEGIKKLREHEWETQRKHKNGTLINVSIIGSDIFIDDKFVGVYAIYIDISQRKKTEEALKESEEKYRTLFELSPFGILLHQFGKIIFANKSAAKMFGAKSSDELIGYELMKLVEPDYHLIVKRRLEELKRTGSEVPLIEEKLVRLDGSVFDAEVIAKEIEIDNKSVIQVLFNDISKRKISELALTKMFERFNLAATAGGIGVWERDIRTGKLEWDERMYSLYEIERDEFPGTYESWLKYLHPDDRLKVENDMKYAINNYIDIQTQFRILLPRNNEVKYIKSFGRLISNKKGEPERLIGVNYDITKQVKSEEEILKSRDKLNEYAVHLQTVRENERDVIARELHDEMGQILSALNISVSSLIRDFRENTGNFSGDELIQEFESLQSMINMTIQRVRKLINELRLEVLGEFSIYEAIIAQFNELKKNTGIDYDFHSNAKDVTLDKDISLGVFRIVQEAITNIIKHSQATNVTVTFNIENGIAELKIFDNGLGITEETMSKQKSWGLTGMKERAQLFNGTLSINSQAGKGTEIVCQIPIEEIVNC